MPRQSFSLFIGLKNTHTHTHTHQHTHTHTQNNKKLENAYQNNYSFRCNIAFLYQISNIHHVLHFYNLKNTFSYSKAYHNAHFGAGQGMIWLGSLDCVGYENDLTQCRFYGWGGYGYCGHSRDAGVDCNGKYIWSHNLLFWN
jgi:hypothetical protein